MFTYSLKRFVLRIPVLLLLITVVFLLSRLLPGTYGSENIQYGEGATYTKSTQQQRDKVYTAYLRHTGQDLPLFYFGVSVRATPIQNSSTITASGKLLEQLSWQFGDPEKAKVYYNGVNSLALLLKHEDLSEQLPLLYKLQNTLNADSITFYTKAMSQKITTGQARAAAANLHQAAIELVQTGSSLNFLIPSLRWNGTSNQYHQWLLSLIKGDLGKSFRDARPVSTMLWEAVGNTFWLILASMLLTIIIALELSIIMVRKTNINWHRALLPGLYILDSIPLFVLSLILLILFATPDFLPLFPVFGLGYHSDQSGMWFNQVFEAGPYLVLPITCLVLANLPYLTNQIYRSLADTMQANFIITAHSKGLQESRIIRHHALRNALLPIITILSDFLPALVAGSVVIETIFAIPGIGRLLFTSVLARDFPVVLGIVLLIALVKMASHLIADICYALADPRVRKATA